MGSGRGFAGWGQRTGRAGPLGCAGEGVPWHRGIGPSRDLGVMDPMSSVGILFALPTDLWGPHGPQRSSRTPIHGANKQKPGEALKKRVIETRILECALWRGGARGRRSNYLILSNDEKIFGSI